MPRTANCPSPRRNVIDQSSHVSQYMRLCHLVPPGDGQGVRARGSARNANRWKTTPKYIVCDRGSQFDCSGFRTWCRRKGIKPPRYGAIGKHGSLAVVERAIWTIKCLLSCMLLVPYRREAFTRELACLVEWYNEHRPHSWLGGRAGPEKGTSLISYSCGPEKGTPITAVVSRSRMTEFPNTGTERG